MTNIPNAPNAPITVTSYYPNWRNPVIPPIPVHILWAETPAEPMPVLRGWRYLNKEENVEEGDEYYANGYWNLSYNRGSRQASEYRYRRRVAMPSDLSIQQNREISQLLAALNSTCWALSHNSVALASKLVALDTITETYRLISKAHQARQYLFDAITP